jgi:hypothetical protein
VAFEQRIAEDLEQVRRHAGVVFGGQTLDVEGQDLAQLDEERGGDRPAVVLDQVQVAG